MRTILFVALVVGMAALAIDSAAHAQGTGMPAGSGTSTGPIYPPQAPTVPPAPAGDVERPYPAPGANVESKFPGLGVTDVPPPSRGLPPARSGLNSDPSNPSGAPGPGSGLSGGTIR
jgi:hypothetical protein